MSRICNRFSFALVPLFLVLSLGAASVSTAQVVLAPPPKEAPEPNGSFRLINATGLPGAALFFMDGQVLHQAGYQSGDVTGTLLPSGPTMRIGVKHPACGTAMQETVVNVSPSQQIAVIAYLEPDPPELATGKPKPATTVRPKSADDGVKKRTILFGTLEAMEKPSTRTGSVLSFCTGAGVTRQKDAPPVLEVLFGTAPAVLTYNKQATMSFQLPASRGTTLPVVHAGKSLAGLDLEKPCDTAVIFFDDVTTRMPRCITYINNRHR